MTKQKKVTKAKLKALFSNKCPRCYQGDLFFKPFTLKTAYKMPTACPNCMQTYEPEPGFYYGAMFLSYIMAGFTYLGLCLLLVFGLKWSVEAAFGVVLVLAILGNVSLFRFSRALWLYLNVKAGSNELEPNNLK